MTTHPNSTLLFPTPREMSQKLAECVRNGWAKRNLLLSAFFRLTFTLHKSMECQNVICEIATLLSFPLHQNSRILCSLSKYFLYLPSHREYGEEGIPRWFLGYSPMGVQSIKKLVNFPPCFFAVLCFISLLFHLRPENKLPDRPTQATPIPKP